MSGFLFKASELEVRRPVSLLPECGKCGLYQTCQSPKMPVAGKGKMRILVVGEAPGRVEDEQGKPFVGESGQELQQALREFDVDLFHDCWVTNALICRPTDNKITNKKSIAWCRPNVVRAIKELKPQTIILLGATPIESVIGWLWKESLGKAPATRWAGWQIPSQRINAWVCPTYHPANVFVYNKEDPVLKRMFMKHLKGAIEFARRPWKEVPDYAKKVQVIVDHKEAAKAIRLMLAFHKPGTPIAIDYETDRLKPHLEASGIVSAAISNGKTTLAYPWAGEARIETRNLLRGPVPKIAANMQFELGWTHKEFGFYGDGWEEGGDVVLHAHVTDNRPGTASVKFQSFVHFGQESYDDHIKKFLINGDKDSCYKSNRIKEISLHQLLLYNGLDALLEWMIWRRQGRI